MNKTKPVNPWLQPGSVIVATKTADGLCCSFEQAREAVSWQAAEIERLRAHIQEAADKEYILGAKAHHLAALNHKEPSC